MYDSVAQVQASHVKATVSAELSESSTVALTSWYKFGRAMSVVCCREEKVKRGSSILIILRNPLYSTTVRGHMSLQIKTTTDCAIFVALVEVVVS